MIDEPPPLPLVASGPPFAEERRLVLLACDSYRHLPPLRCPRNDALAVRDVLSHAAIGGFTTTTELVDGEDREAVLAGLEQGFSGDLVVFYFSGHGVIDGRGALRLALADTDHDRLEETTVGLSELMEIAERSPSDTVVVVLDCCYSGSIADVMPRPGVNQPFTAVSTGQTMHVMTSSTAVQQSYEKEGELRSMFTNCLVAGLETGRADRDNDGIVSVDEAYAYARNLISASGQQDPLRFNYNVRADLVLARNPHYRAVDTARVPVSELGKFQAVRTMIDLVRADEGRPYEHHGTSFGVILLDHYYVEGVPVRASMFTVSPTHVTNIVQTQEGFECDAFFPPEALSPAMTEGKREVNGVYRVRMEVRLESIMIIAGRRADEEEQINLYTGG